MGGTSQQRNDCSWAVSGQSALVWLGDASTNGKFTGGSNKSVIDAAVKNLAEFGATCFR